MAPRPTGSKSRSAADLLGLGALCPLGRGVRAGLVAVIQEGHFGRGGGGGPTTQGSSAVGAARNFLIF